MNRPGTGLRVSIIGAGLMGEWHAHTARQVGARLTVIADQDRGAANRLARRHGAENAQTIDAVIPEGTDVAHVCTPLASHEGIASALLARGIHVLVEKPLTPSAEATRKLLDLATQHGVHLSPVHQVPFQKGIRQARTWLPQLGTVRHLDYVACSGGAGSGGADAMDGVAIDILPHPFSVVTALLDVPADAVRWAVSHTGPGELRLTGHANDASLSILVSMHGRPTRHTCRLIADGGTVHTDLFHGFAVREPSAESRGYKIRRPFAVAGATAARAGANLLMRAWRNQPAYPGLRELVSAFYDACRRGTPPPFSPAEVLGAARARDEVAQQLLTSRAPRPASA